MKQRFSSLDIKVIAHELSTALTSLRLSNVYDLSSRIFLLKFAKPEHREQIVIESGFRCHLTSFSRATASSPSAFVSRLRKFLRTRRVTAVKQIGTDRIIDVQFSEGQYHLFLEFYAAGNIILTDAELNVIALLRTVSEGAEHEHAHVGSKYDLSHRQNVSGVPQLTAESLKAILETAVERQTQADGQSSKAKKKSADALRKALAVALPQYPPILLDHAFTLTGLDKSLLPSTILDDESLLTRLMTALAEADRVVQEITSADVATGYIVAKSRPGQTIEKSNSDEPSKNGNVLYDDYHPFRPCQFQDQPDCSFLEFTGFNKTVDEFYSSIEGQKLESRLQERQDTAQRKIENAKKEHEKRIGGLQQIQELNVQRAQAIEANLDRVEEATAAINGLIAQGMDWHEVGRLIEMEQKRRNPVADIIRLPLKLHENTATLALAPWDTVEDDEDMADETDSEASDDDDDNTSKPQSQQNSQVLAVDIDLSLSAWANARGYYENRKAAATKQDKTMQASAKALKSTELKIKADLKKGLKQEKQLLTAVRKQMWFEKFIYFISSDGYLVLGGKDAQQNDLLYKRHLDIGDVYVSADLSGATSVIIKNNPNTPLAPIPPSTLSQAGSMAVCTSTSWDSKAVMSAWWVDVKQVSKTAPTGDYLQPGRFNIDGKKNFLPPAQLLLGFALMFRIDEDSKARHNKHRVTEIQGGQTEVQTQPADAETDSDDEFPDAGQPVKDDESDDDEFPDAGVEESADEMNDTRQNANPLQPCGQDKKADEEDSEDDADDEPNAIDESSSKPQLSTGKTAPSQHKTEHKPTQAIPAKPKPKPTALPRGKRTKAKKAAAKYADQDEEERKLAMTLLGAKIKDDNAAVSGPESDGKNVNATSNKTREQTEQEDRARRRAQHELTQKQGLEEERARRERLESNIRLAAGAGEDDDVDDDADEDDQQADPKPATNSGPKTAAGIETLIGYPLPGDTLLEAIPVCAPWSTLAHYKYKAKLQPGAAKKGKAVREVLGRWTADHGSPRLVDPRAEDREKLWPREGELIRGLKEAECMVVPVKSVRLVLSGGAAGAGAGKGKGGGKGRRGGRGSKRK